jgi:PAS domain S-box-containing protein
MSDWAVRHHRKWQWIALFCVVTLVFVALGYFHYRSEMQAAQRRAHRELHAIAELKIRQIQGWRSERIAGLNALTQSPFFTEAVAEFVRHPGSKDVEPRLRKRLMVVTNDYRYHDALLAGLDGKILLSAKEETRDLDPSAIQTVEDSLRAGRAVFGSLYRCSVCGGIHIDAAAPIPGDGNRPVAVLVFRIDPETELFPLIQSWPTPAKTPETLLVRKQGDHVLFLNELRHQSNTALKLREPLTNTDLPAVMAVLGKEGIVEGKDYRGAEVLADILPVPGTLWFMVAKADRDEIFARAHEEVRIISFIVVLLVVLSGVGTGLIFVSRQKGLYADLYQVEKGRAEAREELRIALYSIGDGVIISDKSGNVQHMNRVAERLTGWTEGDALGRPLREVFNLVNELTREPVESPARKGLREDSTVWLSDYTVLVAKDGSECPIADSAAPVRDENGVALGAVVVFRDQRRERVLRQFADTRLSLIEYAATHALDELLTRSLDEVGIFVDSPIGFYHFVEPDQKTLSLQQWSTRTLKEFCRAEGNGMRYGIDQAGVWVDCVYEKKPVIHNDYASLPNKKGMPAGHAPVIRELVAPVIREGKVVAILGVGNKPTEYTQEDVGIVSYLADVTWEIIERKRSQEKLRENEERYRLLFENMNNAVAVYHAENDGEDFTLVDFNRAGEHIEQISRGAVLGKRVTEVFPGVKELGLFQALQRVRRTGLAEECATGLYRDDRMEGYRRNFVYKLPSGEVVAVYSDETERQKTLLALQESEKRNRFLAEVIENSCQPFGIGYPDGRLGYVNRAFCELTGYSEEELRQTDWNTTLTPPEWIESEMTRLAELEGAGVPARYEKEYIRKDGTRVPVELLVHVVRSETGEPLHYQAFVTDLTERKLTEKDLLRARKDWEDVFQAIGHLAIIIDLKGNVLNCNEAALRALGKSEEEALGAKCYNLFHSLDHRPDVCPLAMADVTGEFSLEETEVQALGRYYLVKCTPLVDQSGLVRRFIHIATDITQRKRAEEALRRSEQKYRNLFDTAPVGIMLSSRDGKVMEANQTLLDIFGYAGEEISSVAVRDMYFNPSDLAEFEDTIERQGYVKDYAVTIRRKDGAARECLVNSTVLYDPDGTIAGHQHIVLDITERKRSEDALKQSEQRYRALFEESMDGVYSVLREGEIKEANASFCRLFGYTRDETIGRDIRELYFDPADRRKFQEEIEKKGAVKDYEIKFRKNDGTEVDCLLTSSVHYGQDGTVIGYRGILRDLTLRKGLQRQLAQAQKMEAIGTLAGGVAHDFNNLLTVTSGYTEILLQMKDKNDPDRADLEKILHASRRGAELVRHLLTFSRKSDSKPAPINLNQVVDEVKGLLVRTIPKMIDIRLDPAKGLRTINADSGQIEQILMNLAVNARDAMPDGGVFNIKTENASLDDEYATSHFQLEPGEYVILSVSDTGHGMDKATQDHIFEPFFTTKQAGKGTGLGLATVYGIVRQHGGHITCYSEPGKGTTFRIYLPIIEMEMDRDLTTTGDMPAFGIETILVVDDEEFIRELGKRILSRWGYTVLTAADGREALDVYRNRKEEVSLIILDWVMPEMGGKQCLEEVRSIDPNVKVLVASGLLSGGTSKEAIRRGAKGFVGKPYNVKELLRTVREILDQDG